MFGGGFKASKLRAQLELSGSRIKVIRTKKQNQLIHKRRDIGQLLATGQEPRARIRAEDLMREENTVAAYDILELYCELLVTRMPIIETQKICPADLKEPVASIIWAAPRAADLPELLEARKMLAYKYGKDFVVGADELRPECGVSRMVINRLSVRTPTGEEKLEVLRAVAKEQNVEWDTSLYEKEIESQKVDILGDIGSMPEPYGFPQSSHAQHQQQQQPVTQQNNNHGSQPHKRGEGSWVPDVAGATAAAVAAHALGKHFDDSSPPPPFQPSPASAPGKPTEAFLNPSDYDRQWHEGSSGGAPAAGAGAGGNPLNYPPAPSYQDGKVLPKDPMDYTPSAMNAAGRNSAGSEFPSVPSGGPGGPAGGGGFGGFGAGGGGAGAGAPGGFPHNGAGDGGRVTKGDEFSHTSVFQRRKQEREEQMRAIEEAGNRVKAAADRASKAAGLVEEPKPKPSGGAGMGGMGWGQGGPKGGPGGGGGAEYMVNARLSSQPGVGKASQEEFPTPPQGFAGASAFDEFVDKGGDSSGSGSGSDFGLPTPPAWNSPSAAPSAPPPARGGVVLPPPPPPPSARDFDDFEATHPSVAKPSAPEAPAAESPLPGLEDLKARFARLRERSSDRSQPSGYN